MMRIHKGTRSRYQVQVPLTALIDIVFLLLIYFLLTTNFLVDEGIRIRLPHAEAVAAQKEKEITIYVDRKGRAYLGSRRVAMEDLFSLLKEKIGGRRDLLVVIRADRDVVLDRAVRVMDTAKAAGAARLCLATERDF
ncbi:MAG: biopolymer transporter ExbD [Deltaproteobacteria bacterium]|nr:biopolymer transporter ExbD [Deltaproteobacteria bacterium]MBW1949650.1 biopolymer transporter ExbD [Deltaproteobacteria bacterium]MBW2346674.1 biopolymer transporter ExbD [Deltaproteobacteria bacterium]RLB38031.1 MAG: biopolymer transporter ExbD [Deltaproteobacteria bacterium]